MVCLVALGVNALFILIGFVLFVLTSVVGMVETPANPGSFLMAACRLTNWARSFNFGVSPFSLIAYDASAHLLMR